MSLPETDEADVQAVADVIRSGRLALGPRVKALEALHCEYVGVKHALAVSAGLAALQRTLCYHFCPSRYNGIYAGRCYSKEGSMTKTGVATAKREAMLDISNGKANRVW